MEKSPLLPLSRQERSRGGRRRVLLFFTVLLTLLVFSQCSRKDENARFEAIYNSEYKWRQSLEVSLPDVGPEAQQSKLDKWTSVAHQLKRIRQDRLSQENQMNYEIYHDQVAALLSAQRFRDYEMPLNSDTSFWSYLGARARLESEKDAEDYLGFMKDIPRYFEQQIANMREGLKRGFTAPRVTLMGREESVRIIIKSGSFMKPFDRLPASIPKDVQKRLRSKAEKVIKEAVNPAHERLLDFLVDDYIPHSRTSLAAHSLPNGTEYYQSKIKEFTTLDLSPDEIHQIGLDEVSKIHKRMLEISEPHGNFSSFLHFLRTDPQFYAKTSEQLLKEAAWISKQFDGVSGQWFGRLPRQRFAIIPVPDDIAPYWTSGRGGDGVYFVNTYDLPSRPLYSLRALTLHESAPGHALQGSLTRENTGLPNFRHEYISAFGEGWGLYCETLGVEMGMYETEYDLFGMLSYQMWRAARLVVDTGVHALGWTREQAQQFLADNTALSTHEIETEVDRYISWPGQALSYYLGQLTILKERARAEKELGENFDIRQFHDTLLDLASVPLDLVTKRITRFIEDGGRGPYE